MDLNLYSLTSFALSVVVAAAVFLGAESVRKSRRKSLTINQWLALGMLIAASLTATSTAYFGWNEDRREAAEAQLKVRELELKIAELEQTQARQNANREIAR